jgi:6-phosphogluconate dehydrogenase
MQIGMVGLGKMGLNMTRRLRQGNHSVVVFNKETEPYAEAREVGAVTVNSLEELVAKLAPPRAVWMMVPSGAATNQVSDQLGKLLQSGDLLVDGGNTFFKDSITRAARLAEKSVGFLDVGTSGGVWGLKLGYCMMVGGEPEHVTTLKPALDTLAPPDGWKHVGPAGAGHYVKMVHNGIEYGLMAAYAEGFEILESGPFDLDLHLIAGLWNRGSVVRSWLLELTESAFAKNGDLSGIRDWVADSGEGRWTVAAAIEQDVPAPIITLALQQRLRSRQAASFSARVLAALRNEFGGHEVKKVES